MRRKGMVATIVAAILCIALAVTMVAAFLTLKYYVVVGGQLYPRNQVALDLTGRAMTMEEYDRLASQMPDCRIRWSVPFRMGYVPSDVEELNVYSLESRDVQAISYFTNLKTIHAEDCNDYEELLTLYRTYPNIRVLYSVEIGGKRFSAEETAITLEHLPEAEVARLACLPNLKTVDATRCPEYDTVRRMAEQNPQWEVRYQTSIAGAKVDVNAVQVELTEATADEVSFALSVMPKLREIVIQNPDASGSELQALRKAHPDVKISWNVEIEGHTFGDAAQELDISWFPLPDLDYARGISAKFPQLETFIVDSGAVENEAMAAFRDEMRGKFKVVWTVSLGKICSLRTDATTFMPIKQGDYYFNDDAAYNLRYCEEIVCMDVGHAPLHNVEFAAFMPHLRYLILTDTQIRDLSPLSGCQELVFLELDNSLAQDYSPLLTCTGLEDLNIGGTYADVQPLTQMTWLKNLWCVGRGYGNATKLSEALPDTYVNYQGKRTVDGGWRKLENYFAMRDMLGMGYMD